MVKYLRKTIINLLKINQTTSLVNNTVVPAIDKLYEELDALRSKLDGYDILFEQFQDERQTQAYKSIYEKENPLVSVCIGTYNRGKLLVERSLKSVLRQDYEHLDIVVVGDCCTDNTEDLISKIGDSRIRFVNLPERGVYPDFPARKWLVAGTATVNHALTLAKGDFITHLDDDDEYTPDRIKKLITFIQDTNADLVWHPFWSQNDGGKWGLNKSEHMKKTQVTTSSVFYHHWFKQIPWDINAHKYLEPGDWNRFRKIKYLAATLKRYPEPLLRHYKEHNQ